MPTRPETVDRIVAALASAGAVRSKRMFGEWGLYLDDKFIGAVCDEQLFFKITPGSRPFLDPSHDAPPYPGASPYLCVPEERWRDTAWLCALARAVAADLPAPKPKVVKGAKVAKDSKGAKGAAAKGAAAKGGAAT